MSRKQLKNSTRRLNDKTKKGAWKSGTRWEDDDVSRLINGIEKDETTYEMALDLNRTYYGVMNARSHVAWALRHSTVLVPAMTKGSKKK